MTEKHHCQNLLLIQKVFVESLERHFNLLNRDRLFPRLADLTELHTGSVYESLNIDLLHHNDSLTFWFGQILLISTILFSENNRFLKKLRIKQKENYVVDSIADLMVDFFSNQAEKLISAYGKNILKRID